MSKGMSLLGALGLGAGLMYLFDSDRGKRRRALIRDRATGTLHHLDSALEKTARDLRNRTRGVLAESMALFGDGEAPDWLLEERVRAEMGRVVRSPGSIAVFAHEGHVTLSGPIRADEESRLVSEVSSVRGVTAVENRLEVHQSPEGVPGLQASEGPPRMHKSELLQKNWSPSARLFTGLGASTLLFWGGRRGGFLGTIISSLGLGLAMRSITNRELRSLAGLSLEPDAIHVQKSINVNAPIEQVFDFWRNFENFPKFMVHVRQVKDLGGNRSHWMVTGPAGIPVEWDAMIVRDEPNRVLSWHSVPGAAVKSAGTVRFVEQASGGTHIDIRMSYSPPAGAVGHAIASVFGADPKHAMDDDLIRLKSLMEEGKTTASGHKVTLEEVR